MADDKKNRGEPDRSRIDMSEDYEVSYWTKELGVQRGDLARLVKEHKGSVDKIRAALNK
jgi:hypothetical protein